MEKRVVLKVSDLSKQYRLGLVGTGTLGDDLKRWYYRLRGKDDPFIKVGDVNDRSTKGGSDYVWALRNINFEVKQGEVLGIIGKNGAGKSTLLKILSRITSPTAGNIKIKGRISSLLEVGTGFHPELTGRENIYLNGAILGMTRAEIIDKEQDIIAFSGCERFVDTPVKRYSSGMRVRLAFAVASFLEPDILVIDEVLAVGDADFQKKAIGKMQDISKDDGRTVLFVSHNMAAVKSLCTRAIVIEHGEICFDGSTDEAVSYYLKGETGINNLKTFNIEIIESNVFKLNSISIRNVDRDFEAPISENLEIELATNIFIKSNNPENYHITFHLYNELGEPLFSFNNTRGRVSLKQGENCLTCKFPEWFFQSGEYFLTFFVIENRLKAHFIEKDIMSFTVIDAERDIGVYFGREPGNIRPNFKWRNE